MSNIIYIDTSKSGVVKVALESKHGKFEVEKSQQFGSQALLGAIQEILAKAQLVLSQINAVKVHTGPGSFTGLKVGVSVANALGFGLNIEVNDKKLETEILYD